MIPPGGMLWGLMRWFDKAAVMIPGTKPCSVKTDGLRPKQMLSIMKKTKNDTLGTL